MASHKSQGFTYLALLFMVAMLGATLALTGHLWKKTMQQEKERELLFIGNQFRRAILLYYVRTPSATKQYPKDLNELIKDNRYPSMQRYLRELYRDPVTGNKEWGIIKAPEGGIMGVHSLSTDIPQKTGNFSQQYAEFANSQKHSDWQFIYRPNVVASNQLVKPHSNNKNLN